MELFCLALRLFIGYFKLLIGFAKLLIDCAKLVIFFFEFFKIPFFHVIFCLYLIHHDVKCPSQYLELILCVGIYIYLYPCVHIPLCKGISILFESLQGPCYLGGDEKGCKQRQYEAKSGCNGYY